MGNAIEITSHYDGHFIRVGEVLLKVIVFQKLFQYLKSNVVASAKFLIGKFLVLDFYDMPSDIAISAAEPSVSIMATMSAPLSRMISIVLSRAVFLSIV